MGLQEPMVCCLDCGASKRVATIRIIKLPYDGIVFQVEADLQPNVSFSRVGAIRTSLIEAVKFAYHPHLLSDLWEGAT
jgi:hypothetical protein